MYRSPTAEGKLEETWVAVKEQFSRSSIAKFVILASRDEQFCSSG